MSFKTDRRIFISSVLLLFACLAGFTSKGIAAPVAPANSSQNGAKSGIQRPVSPKALAAQKARDAALRQRSYVLGPGDVLRVTVPDFPEFSVETMTVLPNGTVSLPFYGTIRVNGRSIADVQAQLRKQLVKRIKPLFANALVLSVPQPRPIIEEPDVLPVFMQVLGAVKTPSQVEIKDGYRVSEVMGVVGGPATGRLDNVKVTLARAGQPLREIDLVEISQKPDSPANIEVRPLDVITVTEIQDVAKPVYITGAVNKQGTYYMRRLPQAGAMELSEKPRLSEALLTAGGLSVPAATEGAPAVEEGIREYKGVLFRGAETIALNVKDALTKNDPDADIVLQPQDRIVVDIMPLFTIRVDGLVRAPGQFQMTPGVRFVDALVKAGGPKSEVPEVVASIWRAGNELPVDLKKAVVSSDPRINPVLQNNDVVQIEEPEFLDVQVTGAVTKGQALKLKLNSDLLTAISGAGGFNLGLKPELTDIKVLRREPGGKLINLDINAVELNKANPAHNITLQSNDVVTVTEIKPEIKYVTIGGQVNKQGTVEFEDNLDLYDLILRAGGPTERAALSQVVVQRDGKSQIVDVFDAVKGRKPLNFPVQSRDVITIPEHMARVVVMEAVNRPGVFMIPEKGRLTLLEALTLAGGRQVNARDIVLIRQRSDQPDNPQVTIIDPYPTGKNAKPSTQQLQQELQNGDVVYVYPGKVTEPKSRGILALLGPLSLLFR
jgi:polysaccharide export outer membrane protein